MIGNLPISVSDLQGVAKHGSPMLLNAFGRALGLGANEQAALGGGKLPWWLWASVALAGGVVVGIQVHKRWPEKIPEALR
ncbi:MAG: hypothetical protein LUO93_03025 [Methanomicrobiales archaeon]|nr:hypothetical protein [Methanomicrobiales archaeon]